MAEARLTIYVTLTEPVRLENELCPTCWCASMWVMISMMNSQLSFIHCCTNCTRLKADHA